jgi:hypothetical protein
MLLRQHRHPKIAVLSDGLGIPEMLKLHWLKPPFARTPPDSVISVVSSFKVMKNKFLSISETILVISTVLQLIIMALPWFGISPPENPTNLLQRIWNILLLEIPLIFVLFIFTVSFFIIHILKRKKTATSSSSGISFVVKPIPEKKEIELTKEHYSILLRLLNESGRSEYRGDLEEFYKIQFDKITADFNILRQELLDAELIDERVGSRGAVWYLTSKGLKLAGNKYKELRKDNRQK